MPREQAGGGDAGGPTDRGRDTAGERVDDWQRIESEKPDRDRIAKAQDAVHDPSNEFERAGRAPDRELQRSRPERIEPEDLTAEQRAELEAMSGQPIEQVLERRNDAHAKDLGAEPDAGRPAMELRADLPDDDVYNQVIGAYNRGDIPYDEAVRRLEYLDASPIHSKPLDTSHDVPKRPDQHQGDLHAPSDRSPGETDSERTQEGQRAELVEGPVESDGDSSDTSELNRLAKALRSGTISSREVADQLEAFNDDEPASSETTTKTVRVEETPDGPRYLQLGTPTEQVERFGENIATRESERVPPQERKVNAFIRTAGNAGQDLAKAGDKASSVMRPPEQTGTATVAESTPTLERPQPQAPAGTVAIAVTVCGIVAAKTYQRAEARYLEWYWRDTSEEG